jgi:hypothetical protein
MHRISVSRLYILHVFDILRGTRRNASRLVPRLDILHVFDILRDARRDASRLYEKMPHFDRKFHQNEAFFFTVMLNFGDA